LIGIKKLIRKNYPKMPVNTDILNSINEKLESHRDSISLKI